MLTQSSIRSPRSGLPPAPTKQRIHGQAFGARLIQCASATASEPAVTSSPADVALTKLRQAAARPGAVRPSEVLDSLLALEKAKLKPEGWGEALKVPSARWRLVYTVSAKDVTAATKKQKGGTGGYFPLSACQKFDDTTFENGVFLGPLGHLTFKGPYKIDGRLLHFDVTTMGVGLGPWRFSLPLKQEAALGDLDAKAFKRLPFFLYAYVGEDIIVARGRSGGVALWVRADAEWLASSGALQVYK